MTPDCLHHPVTHSEYWLCPICAAKLKAHITELETACQWALDTFQTLIDQGIIEYIALDNLRGPLGMTELEGDNV
jgi:hypothetical protein